MNKEPPKINKEPPKILMCAPRRIGHVYINPLIYDLINISLDNSIIITKK